MTRDESYPVFGNNLELNNKIIQLEENLGLTVEQISLINMFRFYRDDLLGYEASTEINWDDFPRNIREFLHKLKITANRRSRFNVEKLRDILPSLLDGSYWRK